MFPIVIGSGAAALFALFAYAIYGPEGLTGYPWVSLVFWALIGSGVAVFAADRGLSASLCRFRDRLPPLGRLCGRLTTC
jgi:hypothetical protein